MIQRAVFSYFNPNENFSNKAGFRYFSDFLYTMALTIILAKRQFKEVQIVSSDWGVDLFKDAGIIPTEFSTELNKMKDVPGPFWAYGKLIAYTMQTKPFIHIDNDVFIWEKFPERILNAELCFQSKEMFNLPGYQWYQSLRKPWEVAKVRPELIVKNEVYDYAYNCGICGGNNLEFFKEWIKCSSEYIFAPENQDLFFKKFKNLIIHQNLFHEQYFGSCLIKAFNLRDKVEVIADHVPGIKSVMKYTHLWGVSKRDISTMKKVRLRLKKEDLELYCKVSEFIERNQIEDVKEERTVKHATT